METKKQLGSKPLGLLAALDIPVSELVFWSFRYFLGRQTIHTHAFIRTLVNVWEFLEPRDQALIQRDLEAEFDCDDRARTEQFKYIALPLGDDADRAAWETVRDIWRKPT